MALFLLLNLCVYPLNGNISITQYATLQVGVLSAEGEVSNVVSRTYTIRPFVEHTATIYVRNEKQLDFAQFPRLEQQGQQQYEWQLARKNYHGHEEGERIYLELSDL